MVFVLLIYFCIIYLKLNQTLFKKGLKIASNVDFVFYKALISYELITGSRPTLNLLGKSPFTQTVKLPLGGFMRKAAFHCWVLKLVKCIGNENVTDIEIKLSGFHNFWRFSFIIWCVSFCSTAAFLGSGI